VLFLLRNRIAGAVMAVIGLIFLIVGAYLMVSSTWGTATATATSCQGQILHTGSSRRSQIVCQATWTDAGVQHSGSVTFPGTHGPGVGGTFTANVHGDQMSLPTPLWARLVTIAVGAVLLAVGLLLSFRRRPTGVS
jgi:hypothetical protein